MGSGITSPEPILDRASLRLARRIVEEISALDMAPGDKYLSEADAIKRHGASRNTLREALRYLEYLGVLHIRSGPLGGAIVDKPGWRHLASTIALVLQFADTSFESLLEARSVIDPGLAELAALNATDDEIGGLERLLLELEDSIGSGALYLDRYLHFWRVLAESTRNQLLALLSPALRAIVHTRAIVPDEIYQAELVAMLRTMLTAIRRRDQDAARRAMREIEVDLNRRLARSHPRLMKQVVRWNDL